LEAVEFATLEWVDWFNTRRLENGPHGFGMGANLNDEAIKAWPQQALRFMARHQWIPEAG